MHRLDVSINSLLFTSALVLLSLNQFLAAKVSDVFSYADEVVVLVLLVCFILSELVFRRPLEPVCMRVIVLWSIACALAFVGNALFGYQESGFAIADDLLNVSRFFLVLVFSYHLVHDAVEALRLFAAASRALVMVIFALAVVNTFVGIGLGSEYRLEIRAFTFGSHAGLTSGLVCPLLAVLLMDYQSNKAYILMAFGILVLTMRTKAFALIALCILLVMFLGKKRKITIGFVLTCVACVGLIGYDSFYYYYLSSDTVSRGMALRASFAMANDSFPFGGGLGTFGSVVSTQYYSYAYIKYGLSSYWGFSQDHSSFVGDGGWASIIAIFGWIGFVIYLAMLGIVTKFTITHSKRDSGILIPALAIIGYSIIAGSAENYYFSQPAVAAALVLGVLLRSARQKSTECFLPTFAKARGHNTMTSTKTNRLYGAAYKALTLIVSPVATLHIYLHVPKTAFEPPAPSSERAAELRLVAERAIEASLELADMLEAA